jgi:ABC-type spermidine/putrescine transport system permease subunit II
VDAAHRLGCSHPAGLLAFIASFGDGPVSMFLADARASTLPVQPLHELEISPDTILAAAGTGPIALPALVLILCDWQVGLGRVCKGRTFRA